MKLFLILTAVSLIEIALFIQLGGVIGIWPTLALIALSALFGCFLLRYQFPLSIDNLFKIHNYVNELENPVVQILAKGMSGLLLIIPGFLTDLMGLLLLIPITRNFMLRLIFQLVARKYHLKTENIFTHYNSEIPIDVPSTEVDSDTPSESVEARPKRLNHSPSELADK